MRIRPLCTLAAGVLLLVACGAPRDDAPPDPASVTEHERDAVRQALPADSDAPAGLPADAEPYRATRPDGSPVAEGMMLGDEPIGEWTYWHDNGQRAQQGRYRGEGRKDGRWRRWSRSGHLISDGYYRMGEKSGDWSYFYPHGSPSMRGPYVLGERHGRWTHWHPGGARAAEGPYLRGAKAGLWRQWASDGSPLASIHYSQIPSQTQREAATPGVR